MKFWHIAMSSAKGHGLVAGFAIAVASARSTVPAAPSEGSALPRAEKKFKNRPSVARQEIGVLFG